VAGGIVLPRQIAGSASGWQLADYLTVRARTDPATGGRAVLELDPLPGDVLWLVDHAVVACTSSAPTSVRWYTTREDPLNLLDGSSAGNFDVADWPVGLQIEPGSALVVVWSGASDEATGVMTAQVRVLRRG